jgi:hypothetical protein
MCNDDLYDEEKKMREDKWKPRKRRRSKPIKEAKVAHFVLALCWPITCIRSL